MGFSNFPHWGHNLSAAVNAIVFILFLFLIVRSFRTQKSSFSSWPPLKRYFVMAGIIACVFLVAHSLLTLGCQADLDYRYAYCKVTILGMTSTMCLGVAIFMYSTIFAYERLLGITPGFLQCFRVTCRESRVQVLESLQNSCRYNHCHSTDYCWRRCLYRNC